MQFTHLTPSGETKMVDISEKSASQRSATAEARIVFPLTLYQKLKQTNGVTHKGSILETARIAGIMAAKQTAQLIPLCHPIPIEKCSLNFEFIDPSNELLILAQVSLHHKTGVEMEALTAASIAALTIYDMCKAISHEMSYNVRLVEKTGGKTNVSN